VAPTRLPAPLWIIFFASGAAGLSYQVIWTRHAGLTLGGSIVAIGTVVATFLLGLAAGAAIGGRWIDRRLAQGRPASFALAAYAGLELAIAAYGVLFGPLAGALSPVLGPLYRSGGEQGVLFNAGRVLLTAVLVLPPTLAMGATLPVLSRYAVSLRGDAARAIGLLYGVNTLGAVAGCAIAGWVLLPAAGLTASSFAVAALNVAIALAALALRRSREAAPDSAKRESASAPDPVPTWIFPAYACAGFAALVLEIAWTRAFILSFGSSVHAFSLVLSCFIFGVGLGCWLMARVVERVGNPSAVFGALQALVAAWALASWIWPLRELPLAMVNVFGNVEAYGDLVLSELAFAAAIIVPPTALMGASWPVLCRLAVGSEAVAGEAVGRLYAWNTAGNILGTVAAAFVILPTCGIHGAMIAACAMAFFTAGVSAWATHQRWHAVAPFAMAAAALLAVPEWDPAFAAAGPAIYGKRRVQQSTATGLSVREIIRGDGNVVFERWDSYGLVTVNEMRYESGGRRWREFTLRINGKTDASTGGDMQTQALTAHLPLLLHPNPREVLVVGLASGATLDAALRHPSVERAECIEISPAVVAAYEQFFKERMGSPTDDPRARLLVTDARSHVLYTDHRYDVIASEPSNLWISGVSNLHTRDHYERCRARLAPGGIMCQFVHAYHITRRDFQSVLATFRTVFPDCLVWEVLVGQDYLLVGLTGGPADAATMAARWEPERVKKHLVDTLRIPTPEALLRGLIGDGAFAQAVARDTALITDDHTSVEYTAPRALVTDDRAAILAALGEARGMPLAALRGGPDRAAAQQARAMIASAVRLAVRGDIERDDPTSASMIEALSKLRQAAGPAAGDPAWAAARDWVCAVALRRAEETYRFNPEGAMPLLRAIPPDTAAGARARARMDEFRARLDEQHRPP